MTQVYTAHEVKKHNHRKSVWMVIRNDVYDVTSFLNEVRDRKFKFNIIQLQSVSIQSRNLFFIIKTDIISMMFLVLQVPIHLYSLKHNKHTLPVE